VHGEDLVVATQGRSFWILDDLAPLRRMPDDLARRDHHLFEPGPTWRRGWDAARIHYHFREAPDPETPVRLSIRDAEGTTLRVFAHPFEGAEEEPEPVDGIDPEPGLSAEAGMNVLAWNLRLPPATEVPGAVGWPRMPSEGPMVPPGDYAARLTVGDEVALETAFTVSPDPRLETTAEEYAAQYDMMRDIHAAIDEAHVAVNRIRAMRRDIDAAVARSEAMGEAARSSIRDAADALRAALRAIEESIIQTKSKSPQDPLNYPIRINDRLAGLFYVVEGDFGPTEPSRQVYARLRDRLDAQLAALESVLAEDVPAFNALVAEHAVPAVTTETP